MSLVWYVVCYMSRSCQQDLESVQSIGPVQIQQSTHKSQVLLQVTCHIHQGCKYPTLMVCLLNPSYPFSLPQHQSFFSLSLSHTHTLSIVYPPPTFLFLCPCSLSLCLCFSACMSVCLSSHQSISFLHQSSVLQHSLTHKGQFTTCLMSQYTVMTNVSLGMFAGDNSGPSSGDNTGSS